jgi:putative FmdB family regulatory protein
MPLYEYRCTACGERTEVLQHLSDSPLKECPRCGGALERVISAPALQFKGSGWYVTDYARRGGNGATGKDDKGEAAKPEKPSAEKGTKKESTVKAS